MLKADRFVALVAGLALLFASAAEAQVLYGPAYITSGTIKGADVSQAMVTPLGGSPTTLANALASGGITIPNSGVIAGDGVHLKPATAIDGLPVGPTTPSTGKFTSLNGWAPQMGISQNSSATLVSSGSNFNPGEQFLFADGCSHSGAGVVVTTTTGPPGPIATFNIVDPGSCPNIPATAANMSLSSTSGAGTGAIFNLSYGPLVSGLTLTGSVNTNNGNTFLTGTPPLFFGGTESTFIGYRPGWLVGAAGSNFNFFAGHNTEGGAGCTGPTYVAASTEVGTDTGRNSCGHGAVDAFGQGVMKFYTQVGTAANPYGTGSVGMGSNTLQNWNGAVNNAYNTALGNGACIGLSGQSAGVVDFAGGTCLGARNGSKLTSATNFLIAGGGVSGNVGSTTFASGNGVILIGSGQFVVDTPAAGTTKYISIENAYIASTAVPTFVSGFGTGAGYHGGTSGATSESFGWNLGSGGTASTGVFAFPTAAPNGWYCTGRDVTNPGSFVLDFAATSATQVTLTSYSRTTNTVAPWTAGDVAQISCQGF